MTTQIRLRVLSYLRFSGLSWGAVRIMSISLHNRHILVGITGGIAAYKAAELVRQLRSCGAEVRVVMTPAATQFITPLTLQALSGNPVHTSLLDTESEAGMGHIELARWADRVLVAPASADFLARLSQGQADDLLAAICLATSAPLILAVAMNQGMWLNQATQANVDVLRERGVRIWGPAEGIQACGDIGPGRMLEPGALSDQLAATFDTGALDGMRVLITAGPTREAIDPVRYITNHSSGKMGYALAQAAIDAGAVTTLVTGPVTVTPPLRLANCVHVTSAQEMYEAVMERVKDADIFIATAAVADFRPARMAETKIKKSGSGVMTLELVKNPDIVATVAGQAVRPFVMGFAAETCDVEVYAREKLLNKKLDVIVANDVGAEGIGFNSDDNAVQVYWCGGERRFEKMSKTQLSGALIELLSGLYQLASSKSEE